MTANGNGNGRLLTVTEVADWLGVSTKTVVRWTRNGKLPFVKLPGGRLRYDPAEIQMWIEAHHGSEQNA
jgi:excisionase family DNA binding protein